MRRSGSYSLDEFPLPVARPRLAQTKHGPRIHSSVRALSECHSKSLRTLWLQQANHRRSGAMPNGVPSARAIRADLRRRPPVQPLPVSGCFFIIVLQRKNHVGTPEWGDVPTCKETKTSGGGPLRRLSQINTQSLVPALTKTFSHIDRKITP